MGLSVSDSPLLHEENTEPLFGFYHNAFSVRLPGKLR